MHKKDYVAIAKIVRERTQVFREAGLDISPVQQFCNGFLQSLVRDMTVYFSQENYNFDTVKFLIACGIIEDEG